MKRAPKNTRTETTMLGKALRPVYAALVALAILVASDRAEAQTQYQGVCAEVSIQILQELTIERIGFLATLTITNNVGDGDITNFSAGLTFENPDLSTPESPNDASGLFFVQPPILSGISDVDGTGIISPGTTAVITWFIIPTIAAGGDNPIGTEYSIGVELGASVYGDPVPEELLTVYPDIITVLPEPQLKITYFQPRDVQGDNPFTENVVESPIPFTLGVLVENVGYGTANNVNIASQQPVITENAQGLLLVAQLLGARVDDLPLDETSLTVNLGDIPPGGCRKGAWDMIVSLSGTFTAFSATYTHADELGGEATSVIVDLNAYFIAAEVKNDQPGRDDLLDFLADVIDDPNEIPDTLFETDCVTLPVNHLDDVTISPLAGLTATVNLNADFESWGYIRLDDPGQAMLPIASVVRSDGKVLDPNNVWTNIKFDPITNEKYEYLNILDLVELGPYQYLVNYETVGVDVDPPVTTIRFAGQVEETMTEYYILPETQIYFTSEDQNPVSILRRVDGMGNFVPALPFTISAPGPHTVEFFAEDIFGNVEAVQTATVVLPGEPPIFGTFDIDGDVLYDSGDSFSVRPEEVTVDFIATGGSSALDASVEIFRGVQGWPVLDGVPSSPTTSATASLIVSGENVDYYRYRIGGGAWSAEFPVVAPLDLSGLSGGVALEVDARNEFGAYLPTAELLAANWSVSGSAAPTTMTSTPSFPSTETDTNFVIAGADNYRYRLDGGPFLVPTPVTDPIVLTGLAEGEHTVDVIGEVGGVYQDEADATSFTWTVDRAYGTRTLDFDRVRLEEYFDIEGQAISFVWDGRNDAGVLLPAGWYTLRVTISDQLGRSTSAVRTIRIGDLTDGATLISDASGSAQQSVDAEGDWVVWQDQRSGDWDIWALDLAAAMSMGTVISPTPRNQEKPATDGFFVVWEDRQPDGTTDIWVQELGTGAPAEAVTLTPDSEERNPAIDWPRVVFERKPVADPSAPWQVFVIDLETDIEEPIDPTTQDQLAPDIFRRRVVWQDLRDAGSGEIYLKDLKTGGVERLTDDLFLQFDATIGEDWVVWADNRGVQIDLYGFHLPSKSERQLTIDPANETRPALNGDWVVYQEDSLGPQLDNLGLLNLSTLASVQLTNTATEKMDGHFASGRIIWEDRGGGVGEILSADIPSLLPVHQNRNMIPVTAEMATALGDAFSLLTLWNDQVGVTALTRFTSYEPVPISESATWDMGAPTGVNFPLEAGSFLWVDFPGKAVLELGFDLCSPIDLTIGPNVLTFTCFPDRYSSYSLIRELGLVNVDAVRTLDSVTGRWRIAGVKDGNPVGEDFDIPRSAVLILDVTTNIGAWTPGSTP